MSLLSVHRPLAHLDHEQLLGHLPDLNRRLSDAKIIWRPVGEAALLLVMPGEYLNAIVRRHARPHGHDPTHLADTMNARIADLPAEGSSYIAGVRKVDFRGRGRILHVACFLHPGDLGSERQSARDMIDETSGIKGSWKDEPFDPYISLGTIEAARAEDRVLDLLDEFVPDELTLTKVEATVLDNRTR